MAHGRHGHGPPAELVRIATALSTNGEDWKPRQKALRDLTAFVEKHPELMKLEAFQLLHQPLETQVKDLRSSIVRETCNALAGMAATLGDGFRKMAWMLLPVLINLSACGNKVISGYVSECVHTVLHHTHVTKGVPQIVELVKHRSSSVRESCFEYLRVILTHWPKNSLARHASLILGALKTGLSDASPTSRKTARQCFVTYREFWPDQADRVYETLDMRTQRLIDAIPPVERPKLKRRLSVEDGAASVIQAVIRGSRARQSLTPRAAPSMAVLTEDDPLASPGSPGAGAGAGAGGGGDSVRQASPRHSSASDRSDGPLPPLGARILVRLSKGEPAGFVRFVGTTQFARGVWVGVELDADVFGRNDGGVKGVQYFDCAPGRGLFVRPAQVAVIADALASAADSVTVAGLKHSMPPPIPATSPSTHPRRKPKPSATSPQFEELGRTHLLDDATARSQVLNSTEADLYEDLRGTVGLETEMLVDSVEYDAVEVESAVVHGFLAEYRINVDEALDSLRQEMEMIAQIETRLDAGASLRHLSRQLKQVSASLNRRAHLQATLRGKLGTLLARKPGVSKSPPPATSPSKYSTPRKTRKSTGPSPRNGSSAGRGSAGRGGGRPATASAGSARSRTRSRRTTPRGRDRTSTGAGVGPGSSSGTPSPRNPEGQQPPATPGATTPTSAQRRQQQAGAPAGAAAGHVPRPRTTPASSKRHRRGSGSGGSNPGSIGRRSGGGTPTSGSSPTSRR